ncbi:hypothetical protein G7Y89_g5109 [Cudoniella acicularis]|uniref:Uncharacterized protein n=1 Tax=Cudoniella acicularis TaxID=354080 RepID=A0A8H4W612_9HELO|nr:hypothetical protein G7Y89_g5109 [Cudoniella acicularis]
MVKKMSPLTSKLALVSRYWNFICYKGPFLIGGHGPGYGALPGGLRGGFKGDVSRGRLRLAPWQRKPNRVYYAVITVLLPGEIRPACVTLWKTCRVEYSSHGISSIQASSWCPRTWVELSLLEPPTLESDYDVNEMLGLGQQVRRIHVLKCCLRLRLALLKSYGCGLSTVDGTTELQVETMYSGPAARCTSLREERGRIMINDRQPPELRLAAARVKTSAKQRPIAWNSNAGCGKIGRGRDAKADADADADVDADGKKTRSSRNPRALDVKIAFRRVSYTIRLRLFTLLNNGVNKHQAKTSIIASARAEVLYTIYEIIALCLVVNWASPNIEKTQASFPCAIITLVAYLIIPVMSYGEHTKTIRPSLLLNGYLLVSLLCDVVRARTLLLRNNDKTSGDFTAGVALKFVILILEAVEKQRILKPEHRMSSPEATSGIYSQSFFWWLNPLFRRGFRQTFAIDYLYQLDKHLLSGYTHGLLDSSWIKSRSAFTDVQSQGGTNEVLPSRGPNTLFWATLQALKWPLSYAVLPRLCLTAFNFCQPFLLNSTIDFSQHSAGHASVNTGYGLIGAYFLVYIGIAVSTGQFQHLTYRVVTMIRGGLISMLYRKAGDLSLNGTDPASSMVLMSADIERITTGWQTIHELWANLLEVAIAIYLLKRQLGAACAVPIAVAIGKSTLLIYEHIINAGVFLVSMTGSLAVTNLVMSRQAMWLNAIEKRISATTTMLGSMKGVKMCGLTDTMSKTLHGLRIDELRISRKFRKLLIWNMGLAYITPVAAPILTFAVFSVMARNRKYGATLDTARIFTSLSLFTLLADPLQSLVMTLATFMGSVGSFQRIQQFLTLDSRVDSRKFNTVQSSQHRHTYMQQEEISPIELADDSDGEKSLVATLQDNPPLSDLYAFAVYDGSFGWDSSKRPLLHDINMAVPRGSFTMIVSPVGCGKSTLLKALLGEIPPLGGYVQCCSPEISFCDQTPWHMNGTIQQSIIGISSLEQAWYSIVVHACVLDEDFRQLSYGDQTSIGSQGISLSGGQSRRIALARAVYARKDIIILDDTFSGLDSNTENRVFHNLLGPTGILRKQRTTALLASSSVKRLPYTDHIVVLNDEGRISEQGTFKNLVKEGGYISSFNLPPPAAEQHAGSSSSKLHSASMCDTQPRQAQNPAEDSATIWVKWWATANSEVPNQRLGYYLGIYGLLGAGALLSLVVSCWQLIITMVPRSGERFHSALLRTVLSAPMSFFSSTDTGITVNRFSQDLMLIDMELPVAALNTFATLILCIAQMVLIGVASVYAAVAIPVVLASLYFIQKIYLRTSRQLRLLDLEAKSPLYSQFMECLSGLATVRAFGWRCALEERNREMLEQSQKPFYLLFAVQRWLTLVLDLIVTAVALILIVLVVELRGIISPGFVGVAMLNVILFSQSIKMLLTFWTNLETHIGSIARVKTFTETTIEEELPQEKQMPPPCWPAHGAIEFKNMCAEYKASEPVLKSISLSIQPGQKIGVCGRTGSGKTSLVLSIFRMIEMSAGTVIIDDIDISTIPRQEIRSRLVGVPQDSYLLAGSGRLNADPLGLATDAEVIQALKCVQLWGKVKENGGLSADIDTLFLSHGQKQLFCLARAMIRPSKILILDESTSSVDAKTDELMQRIIREKFAQHTIIAIAHKLDTILDFDMIALLDEGRVVEFAPPYDLLADPDSAFSKLYSSSYTNFVCDGSSHTF